MRHSLRKKQPFNQSLTVMDDGTQVDGSKLGSGSYNVGIAQNRQRREAIFKENTQKRLGQQPGFGPLKSMFDGLGFGGLGGSLNPQADAFYGLMQMKENSANQQGKRFELDPNNVEATVDKSTMFNPAVQTSVEEQLAGIDAATMPKNDRVNNDIRTGMWEADRRGAGRGRGSAQSKMTVGGQRGGPRVK